MVGRKLAMGLALVSGAGGTGRTTAALNLARYLARPGRRVLLFDMCFGWGGLGMGSDELPGYDELLDREDDFDSVTADTDQGFKILTCQPPEFLDPTVDDMKKIAWLVNRLSGEYDFIIFDSPSGGHPLALLAAGLSERVYLFSRPEAASVASSYSLLKSLHAEGIYSRVRTVFAQVQSPEQAASLKTRFDIMTSQFLGFNAADGGFIYRLDDHSDDFYMPELSEESEAVIKHMKLDEEMLLQNATSRAASGANFPNVSQGRR